ncbi:TPA: hypothetical protein ACNTF0_005222, partial [Escherichia coli]
ISGSGYRRKKRAALMFPGFTVMLENLHKAVSGKLHNNSQQSSDKRNSNLKTMQEDYTAFT